MTEKKYLKWYQKVAYGSGDVAANCTFALISSFMLIYLTNTVGLNSAVVGTLMMASKLLDGITDVFFGTLIDRTKSKMGKARPWMLYSQIGVSLCLFLVFAIPDTSQVIQYAYFFVFYTALNAVFYTANNIAYASLTALITKNSNERVQVGSIRFMFSLATNIIVASVAMGMVTSFGGGVAGWRTVALIFAVIGLAVNTFSCLMVKEVVEEDNVQADSGASQQKISLWQSAKYLAANKYYIIILLFYICMYGLSGITQGVGIYFMTYILGSASLLGTFSMMSMFPMIIALALTPILVKKFKSMWKVNTAGYIASSILGIGAIYAALTLNVPLMLGIAFVRGLCTGPTTGTLNALIAEASGYTYRTKKVRLDGTMYSCSSMGIKLGGGIGSAVCGWLLNAGGYDGMAAAQSQGALNMITAMYVFIPFVMGIIMTILVASLKVEKANQQWDKEHGVTTV